MSGDRFERLARDLAARDAGLAQSLAKLHPAIEQLRARAHVAVESFRRTAIHRDASHLASIEVGPVEADEKHVDCLQFRVCRGRWEIVCVASVRDPEPEVTLVGPFKRGKPEKPCQDFPLLGGAVVRALEDLLERLIREASER